MLEEGTDGLEDRLAQEMENSNTAVLMIGTYLRASIRRPKSTRSSNKHKWFRSRSCRPRLHEANSVRAIESIARHKLLAT